MIFHLHALTQAPEHKLASPLLAHLHGPDACGCGPLTSIDTLIQSAAHTPAHQAYSLLTEPGESYKRVIQSALRNAHMLSEVCLVCVCARLCV